jgi:hypothetical protein
VTCRAALVLCLALAIPAAASAYDPEQGPPRHVIADEDFEPLPAGEGYDWIRLSSGEWLKGDLERIRDGSLEFDSDELDDLVFDTADISGVVTVREHTLVLPDRKILTGSIAVRGDVIKLREGDEIHTFHKEDLVSLVSGTPRELNYWSGKLSLGLTARSGNTDQTELSGTFNLTREDALTRGRLRYNGAVGELEGSTNVDNHRGTFSLDVFLSRRFYVTPLSVEYYRDGLQNLELRLTPATGLGYHVIRRPTVELDVELAAGYQYTEYIEAQVGDDRFDSEAAAIFRARWETDLTPKLEWDGEYQVQMGVPTVKNTNHHVLTTLSFDLWGNLDFDVTFVFDRAENPQQESDGTTPERNDFRLTAGLGWDF